MFLQKQLYFYRTCYKLTDIFNLTVVTWDSTAEVFKKKHKPKQTTIIHIFLYLCYPYMIRAIYLFIKIVRQSTDDSKQTLLGNILHSFGLYVMSCLLLYRTMYTFTIDGIVEMMNAMLRFERNHLKGNYQFTSITSYK